MSVSLLKFLVFNIDDKIDMNIANTVIIHSSFCSESRK